MKSETLMVESKMRLTLILSTAANSTENPDLFFLLDTNINCSIVAHLSVCHHQVFTVVNLYASGTTWRASPGHQHAILCHLEALHGAVGGELRVVHRGITS